MALIIKLRKKGTIHLAPHMISRRRFICKWPTVQFEITHWSEIKFYLALKALNIHWSISTLTWHWENLFMAWTAWWRSWVRLSSLSASWFCIRVGSSLFIKKVQIRRKLSWKFNFNWSFWRFSDLFLIF